MNNFLDERIIEYDIDKVVFDKRSQFQKIQIVHSKTLGHMLVLDELQSKCYERHHLNVGKIEQISFFLLFFIFLKEKWVK